MNFKFGGYELVEKIAAGGMAEIYKARRSGPGGFEKILAIKRTLSNFQAHPAWITLFQREARLAANLNHPNIVQIYDFGEVKGRYYIAMEYLDGFDLDRLVAEQSKRRMFLPTVFILHIIDEVLKALEHAHTRRNKEGVIEPVVHRDISPGNVLISKDGIIKLADFGIAKAVGANAKVITAPGVFMGKVNYAAPEQLIGEPADERTDLYAVGILFFVLATNSLPFTSSEREARYKDMVKNKFPSIRKINASIPVEIEKVLNKALRADRDERFQSATDFREQVSLHLSKYAGTNFPKQLTKYFHSLIHGEMTQLFLGELERGFSDPATATVSLPGQKGVGRGPSHSPSEPTIRSMRSVPIALSSVVGVALLFLIGLGVFFYIEGRRIDSAWFHSVLAQLGLAEEEDPWSVPPDLVEVDENGESGEVSERQKEELVEDEPRVSAIPKEEPSPIPEVKDKPKEKKPPKKAKKKNYGFVTIFPNGPYATVYVDGERIGNTPIMTKKIQTGRRKFVFENKQLNRKRTKTITISKNRKVVLRDIWD